MASTAAESRQTMLCHRCPCPRSGENGAAPYRLPDFRLRHPVGLHCPRHDHADPAVARRVWAHRRAAHPGSAQGAGHQGDVVRPGFTIESHPAACEAVVAGGHEIAHHSLAHIPPAQQSRNEEEADLVEPTRPSRD